MGVFSCLYLHRTWFENQTILLSAPPPPPQQSTVQWAPGLGLHVNVCNVCVLYAMPSRERRVYPRPGCLFISILWPDPDDGGPFSSCAQLGGIAFSLPPIRDQDFLPANQGSGFHTAYHRGISPIRG